MKEGKLFTVASVLLILAITQIIMIQNNDLVSGASTSPQLKLYAGPTGHTAFFQFNY